VTRTTPVPTGASGVSSAASGPLRAAARRSDNFDQPPAELNIIEPYRTINVAAEEVGTIQEVLVREGDSVKQGQILARLNSTVLFAQLAIAEQNSQAQGRLEASLAELQLREHRLSQLRALRTDGAARQEEVDRAQSELAIAQANVRTAREELESRRLECERIKAQIDSRSVKAPIDGVVVKMLKDVGEFVAPNTPDVMTIVQIDQLIARCNISANMLDRVKTGQEHDIRLATGETVKGMIEFIDPVTDGASQMVTVKLRIDNTHGRFRSGEQCWMPLSE
jgi:RND family efflux transporter MFP subunit